jgi:dTDP-4-amino-4,6-dideoxygalactose transaminase
LLSYYKGKYSLRVNDFPIALRNFQQVLSIPNYAALSDDEVEEICEAILDVAATRV